MNSPTHYKRIIIRATIQEFKFIERSFIDKSQLFVVALTGTYFEIR